MSTPTWKDILFASGGYCLTRYGVPWLRRGFDILEPEAPTFTRADASTCATYVDKDGAVRAAAAGKLRHSWVDADGDGAFETPSLLLEPSRANVCLRSENFGATWAAIGTPTRSAAAASVGAVTYDLIGDDDAGGVEGYYQDVAFTGDAVKAVSLFIGQGTATKMFIRLRDESAAAERLSVNITWSGSVLQAAAGVGTVLGVVPTSNGYRVLLQTSSITAANTNRLHIYPGNDSSLTSADTGNAYVGGVQCENAPFPSSYIQTTSAAVTRAADSLTFPVGFGLQDLTVYLRMPRPVWADASGTIGARYAIVIGNAAPYFAVNGASASRAWGVETNTSSAGLSIAAGATQEVCAQVRNWATGPEVRLDVNSGAGFSSWSSAGTPVSGGFGGNRLLLGGSAVAGDEFGGGINRLLVARGLFTLAEMQAVDW